MYFTLGIVLAKKEIGEADILYTLYTKAYGKIRARAQGVRKESGKLRGHLEVLSISSIGFVFGKQGPRLVYARMIRFWDGVRGDSYRLRAAYLITGWIDQQCFDFLPDEPIFEFLTKSLQFLNETSITPEAQKEFLRMQEKSLIALLGGEQAFSHESRRFSSHT